MRILLPALSACFLAVQSPATPYVLHPSDDVLVNQTKVVTPGYYSSHFLSVYYDGAVYNWTFLKFDLSAIPDSAQLTKAELGLFCYEVIDQPAVAVHYVADDNWDEANLLWANKPSYGDRLDSAGQTQTGAWQTFNLLDSGAWTFSADLVDNQLSLLLKQDEALSLITKQAHYRQDEFGTPALRPYLTIEYAVPETAGTIALVGFSLAGLAALRRRTVAKQLRSCESPAIHGSQRTRRDKRARG